MSKYRIEIIKDPESYRWKLFESKGDFEELVSDSFWPYTFAFTATFAAKRRAKQLTKSKQKAFVVKEFDYEV